MDCEHIPTYCRLLFLLTSSISHFTTAPSPTSIVSDLLSLIKVAGVG